MWYINSVVDPLLDFFCRSRSVAVPRTHCMFLAARVQDCGLGGMWNAACARQARPWRDAGAH
eukprot:4490190-Pyramimonas_sp.AAC.1